MADKKNITIGLITAAVVGLGVLGFMTLSSDDKKTTDNVVTNNRNDSQTTTVPTLTSTSNTTTGSYKNGTYTAEGEYVSPGGIESVMVSLVVENGVVKSAEFTPQAKNSTSKQYQGLFSEGYNDKVVGKKVDEISLDKVSGSSLTSRGFMDALEKIKNEAKS